MVNGSPTEPFKMQNDLRQGDPTYSFLLSIVGESLSYIMQQGKLHVIDRLKIGGDEIEFTHLQFADDILIFLPQDTEKLINYRRLL